MADKDKKIDDEPEEETIAKDIVVTKYKMAAEIVNGENNYSLFRVVGNVLLLVISTCEAIRNGGKHMDQKMSQKFKLGLIKQTTFRPIQLP